MSSVEERLARLEDLEAIRALDAEYCRLLDDNDWPALVRLFTDDGEFVGLNTARGHADLRSFFGGLAGKGLTAYWHHVTNLEIQLAGDTAEARSFLWQPCVLDGVAHLAAGRYNDTLVRTGDGWRYVRKQVSFEYFVPMTDGFDHGRFSLESARATYRGRAS